MKNIRNIIIDNHQGIGDVVHMLPLIENIRVSYPKAHVTMIIKFADECVLLAPGLIDDFIIWKDINIKIIQKLRARHYDLAYLNVITNCYKGILYLKFAIGADKVVSEFSFSKVLKHYLLIERKERLHRVLRNNRLSKISSLKSISEKPDLWGALFSIYNNNYVNNVSSKFKSGKIIGICMGSAPTQAKKGLHRIQKNVKQWPLESIWALCLKLSEIGCDVVLLGGADQKYIGNVNIPVNRKGYIHNYIGKCTLAESMQLISLCSVCVGVDTGLMHMAAALDIPTVTLFGPTDPKEFAPYSYKNVNITLNFPCQYCYRKPAMYDCQNNECMKKISVGKVLKKVTESLEDKKCLR